MTTYDSRLLRLAAAAAVLVLVAGVAGAQTLTTPAAPSKPNIQGAITFGAGVNDTSGALDRASEYDFLRDGGLPRLRALVWGSQGRLQFDAHAQYGGDERDQTYWADLRYARWLKVHARYMRSGHRLDHDPLTYVDSASGIGGTFVVGHTDYDPSARYSSTRGDFEGRVEIAPTKLPIRLWVGHRQETRAGVRQSLTADHCSTCHVSSYSRGFDEKTREFMAGARLALQRFSAEYSYLDRRFGEDAAALTHTYQRGLHPVTLADVFLNRLQYDGRSGPLEFDLTPDSKKGTHLLRTAIQLPGDASVSGTFTRSRVTNDDTGVDYSYTGGTSRLVVPIGSQLVFRGAFRRYELEADDVFVDVVEQISPAGPTAGKTYAEAYPTFGEPDYVRESSLSRTPTDVGLDLTWTPAKRSAIQVGYAWEALERTSFDVQKTTTSTVTLRARTRPWKAFEARSRFQQDWVTDPFMFERAAVPAVLQPFMSPGNLPFTGLQYYEMYGARQADLTSFPTRSTRFDQSFTWSPSARVSVSGHYRVNVSDNEDLNFSRWSRTAHSPGAEIYVAPGERWTLMAGYTMQRERLESMLSILAFGG
jgi:hypothetical protein